MDIEIVLCYTGFDTIWKEEICLENAVYSYAWLWCRLWSHGSCISDFCSKVSWEAGISFFFFSFLTWMTHQNWFMWGEVFHLFNLIDKYDSSRSGPTLHQAVSPDTTHRFVEFFFYQTYALILCINWYIEDNDTAYYCRSLGMLVQILANITF